MRRLVDDGFAVHVYVSLILDVSGTGNFLAEREFGIEDPAFQMLSSDGLRQYIHGVVQSTGACLMCVQMLERPPDLPPIPANKGQITAYPPSETDTGRRLLNLWLMREHLWNATLQHERALGMKYDFLMTARDDSYWTKDMARASELLQQPGSARMIWTRRCGSGTHDAVNDRSLMFGRAAAPAMLTLYSSFMFRGGHHVKGPMAESFIKAAAVDAKAVVIQGNFSVQPEITAMWYRDGEKTDVCMIRKRWCEGRTRVKNFRATHNISAFFCDEVVSNWKV